MFILPLYVHVVLIHFIDSMLLVLPILVLGMETEASEHNCTFETFTNPNDFRSYAQHGY